MSCHHCDAAPVPEGDGSLALITVCRAKKKQKKKKTRGPKKRGPRKREKGFALAKVDIA